MERNAHLEFRPHTLPQGSPKLTCELWVSIRNYVLWVSIRNYVLWEAMVLEDMCEEQPTYLLGHGLIFCVNEMCHLAKSIHHHHDGIISP